MNKMFSRGLALAMAGMMAITAVPATPALADDPKNDGLTTTEGIDSIKGVNKELTTWGSANTDNANTNFLELWLKEHDDVSYNKTDVKAFRITSEDSDFLRVGNAEATTKAAGAPADLNAVNAGNKSGGSIIVENVPEGRDLGNNFKTAGGVNVYLVAAQYGTKPEKTRKVKVTIESLGNINSSTALDKTVITVTIKGKDEVIKTSKSSVSLAENDETTVGAETVNRNDIVMHRFKIDNTSVATFVTNRGFTTPGAITLTSKLVELTPAALKSEVIVKANQSGTAEITVEGCDGSTSAAKVVDTQTISVNVTTNNGRLSVSFMGTDDKTKNFTDDRSVNTDKVITRLDSANLKTDDFAGYLNAVTTGTQVGGNNAGEGARVQSAAGITNNINTSVTGKATESTNGDAAAVIALNMQDKKSAQVTASSAISENVSFKLLAAEKKTDVFNANSEKVAAAYASLSKDGLVTAKKAFPEEGRMYICVYVEGKDEDDNTNERGASVYFIPLTISEQGSISLYVSDSKNAVDIEFANGGDNTSEKLYLSMKDRTTDSLYIDCNAGAAYVEGSSSDSNVVTYKNGTITALKTGTATITVKTTSAPDFSGIAEIKIPVVVNELESDATISAEGVTISRDVPSANIVAKGTADNNIVFEGNALYKKSAKRPSGYELIKEEKEGRGDVTITTAGRVSYQQNNGVVYVRAQGKISGTKNPTPWIYIPVAYGEGKVDSDLTVANASVSVKVGATAQINANATGVISYKSSDEAVATVDAAGVVTGISAGTATITVDASATEKMNAGTKTVTVTVTKATTAKKANTIKVTPTKKTYKVKAVKKAKKTFTIKATKAKGTVSYSVAKKVKKAGITVTKKGKVTVKKGTKKGTYKITVKAKGNKSYKAATKTVKVVIK